jgi:hypothetical protein
VLKLRTLFRLHRALGAFAAAFVLMLAVTGVLLNHTEDLRLDHRYVSSNLLLDWYGIKPPRASRSFRVDGHWVTEMGERLYFDRSDLADLGSSPLVGAVGVPGIVVVAQHEGLLLLSPSGQRIEMLQEGQGVPAAVQRIGTDAAKVVVSTPKGDYRADGELLQWDKVHDAQGVVWASPQPLPPALEEALLKKYRGQGLPWERVLLDLHSGRILGRPGEILVDLVGLGLLFLACTGVWMWWRVRQSTKGRLVHGAARGAQQG